MDNIRVTIECSRCEMEFTDTIQDMYKRTDQHINRHREHLITDERHPDLEPKISRPMGGLDYGDVEWITINIVYSGVLV